MEYRVNYGNGKVCYPGDLGECQAYHASLATNHAYVEFQDNETGEWFHIKYRQQRERLTKRSVMR